MLCKIGQERLLNVSWKPVWEKEAYYTGTLRLIIIHKTSALAALVNIIDQTDARIVNLKIKGRTADHWDLRVDLEADDDNHFDAVMLSPRGQAGLEAKFLASVSASASKTSSASASASSIWPRPVLELFILAS